MCDSGIAKVCKKAIGWTKSGLDFEGLAISPCQSQNSTKKVLFYLLKVIKVVCSEPWNDFYGLV